MKITAEPMVPVRNAFSGDEEENIFTSMIPMTEQMRPADASARGKNINACRLPPRSVNNAVAIVEAIAMVAMMAPQ